MIKTSYFSKYKGYYGVSISLSKPKQYICKEYKKLAPPYWLLQKYKQDKDTEYYIQKYQKNVLDKLNPSEVYNDLLNLFKNDEDIVLLCWEKSGDFCHRHLIAKWLEDNIENLEIEEI